MTWFLKFLRHSDVIGKEPSLMLGKDSRNRTILGGFLCISIFLCALLGLFYFGQEIYYKRNPNIITSNVPFAKSDSIRIDNKNSAFYFSIRDSSGNPLKFEEGYLNLNITLNSRNMKGGVSSLNQISKRILTYKNCEKNNFIYSDSNSLINPSTRENWKCLNDSDYSSISLAGNQQAYEYSFININVKPCSIDVNTCKSPEEIKKAISGAYLVFGYNEYLFDLRKSKTFADSYLKEEKIFFSSLDKSSQFIEFELKKYHFYTDTGILIQDFQEDTFFKYKLINKEMIFKENTSNNINDNPYIEINLIPSEEKKNVYRKYYKIQNLIAEIGGLSKSFVLIALVLNYLNDESRYYTILIDNLFDGDDVFKYFQYYHHSNKKLHKKYRDSVILTSSKKIESFIREKQSPHHSLKSKSHNAFNTNSNGNSPNLLNNFLNDSSNNILKEKTQQQNFIGNSSNLSKSDDCGNYDNKLNNENFEKLSNHDSNNHNNEIIQEEPNKSQISKSNSDNSQTVYFNVISDNLSIKMLSEKLKKSKLHKENFYKLQKKKFRFNSFDMIKYIFCPTTFEYSNKRSIFYGGKMMIQKRTDIINILKKNLEFDRFKNLLLEDYQILQLNSLNKFMLDPERLELVDYENSNYEKIIDAYIASRANNDKIDSTLTAWVKSKFHFSEK
jgi:hypothetical protein